MKTPSSCLQRPSVGIGDITEQMRHPALLGTPRELLKRRGIRPEEKVRFDLSAEAVDRRCVKGDPLIERAGELLGHDRNVPLLSENIAESKADEFDILFADVLHHFIGCVSHFVSTSYGSFFSIK